MSNYFCNCPQMDAVGNCPVHARPYFSGTNVSTVHLKAGDPKPPQMFDKEAADALDIPEYRMHWIAEHYNLLRKSVAQKLSETWNAAQATRDEAEKYGMDLVESLIRSILLVSPDISGKALLDEIVIHGNAESLRRRRRRCGNGWNCWWRKR